MTWQPADVTDTCKKRRHVEPLLALSPTAFLSFSFSLLNFRDDIFAFSCLSKSFFDIFHFSPDQNDKKKKKISGEKLKIKKEEERMRENSLRNIPSPDQETMDRICGTELTRTDSESSAVTVESSHLNGNATPVIFIFY